MSRAIKISTDTAPRRRPGPRTKLTPELQDRVVQALRVGNYATVAIQYAGISEHTYYEWLVRGEREPGSIYGEFFRAVRKAEADAEVEGVAIIEQAGRKEWQARAWLLERKYPYKWGRFERQEHTGQGELVIRIAREGDDDATVRGLIESSVESE